MSTLSKVNFEPCTDILPVHRRDYALADKTLCNPLNALALVDGEWMTVNSSNQILRAVDITSAGNEPGNYAFLLLPTFAERGRYDVQAIADKKMPVLLLGEYEIDTRIFDSAAVVGSGAAFVTGGVGQPLKVASVTFGGKTFSGLVGATYNEAAPTKFVGYITRLPANNNGKLRFVKGWRR